MGDSVLHWIKNLVLPVGIGIFIAFGLKAFVASAAVVPSASMYPTIPAVSQTQFAVIAVDKLSIELSQIHRGEVVVFHFPDNPSELYVKRVVGMPGDTVQVTEKAVYINGQKLDESNLNIARSNGLEPGTYHVPTGFYFMLGDNRPASVDSRMWVNKYVARSAIVGEAKFYNIPI